MRFSDLVDLETQLALDANADDDVLHARDRALAVRLPEASTREAKIVAWTRLVRGAEASLGEDVVTAIRLGALVLAFFGALLGASACAVALEAERDAPVNVAVFLAGLVAPQLVFLLGTLVWLVVTRSGRPTSKTYLRVLERIVTRFSAPRAHGARIAALFGRLEARRGLSSDVERSGALWLAQMFAIGFNVAALATLLGYVVTSDLRFGWSSTLIDWSGTMLAIVRTLASPWSWVWPSAVPSAEVVEATQYFRHAGIANAAVAGQWWPFLVACLATYGLLPRVILALYGRYGVTRALRVVPLDTPDVDALLARLERPALSFGRHAPLGPLPVAAPVELAAPREARTYWPVPWRGFPFSAPHVAERVHETFGGALADVHPLGGPDHVTTEQSLRELPSRVGPGDAVLVLCEAFDPPDRGLRRMLTRLRDALGAKRTIVVGLVEQVAADGSFVEVRSDVVQSWRTTLDVLADPYLRVEALRGGTNA